jgi:hypothetical protein
MGSRLTEHALLLMRVGLLLILPAPAYLQAQDSSDDDPQAVTQQVWIDFYPHFYVNEKLEYYGDIGYRANITDFSWSRIYTRPSVKYHLSETFEMQAGIGLFFFFDSHDHNRLELTPWQGVQVNWPEAERIQVKHLFKIEERMSFTTGSWDMSFSLRARYKLSGNINIIKKSRTYLPLYGEIFLPVNDEIKEVFRNRGRAGLGIGYKTSKGWRLEFIMNWQSSRSGLEDNLAVSDFAYQLKLKTHWKSRIID